MSSHRSQLLIIVILVVTSLNDIIACVTSNSNSRSFLSALFFFNVPRTQRIFNCRVKPFVSDSHEARKFPQRLLNNLRSFGTGVNEKFGDTQKLKMR